MKKLLIVAFYIICSSAIYAQCADDIKGIWWNEAKTVKIKVDKKDGKYIGTVVYIIPKIFIDGAPAMDDKNPDVTLRRRSVLNLQILSDLVYDPFEKDWKNGMIYDPKTGNTYECLVWLAGKNTLQLKGFVAGIRMLGRKSTCTRTTL